jgi:hypothetical protein
MVFPDIAEGAVKVVIMATGAQLDEETIPQAFVAVTQTLPGPVPLVTEMEFVPCPLLITQPDGTVQM